MENVKWRGNIVTGAFAPDEDNSLWHDLFEDRERALGEQDGYQGEVRLEKNPPKGQSKQHLPRCFLRRLSKK